MKILFVSNYYPPEVNAPATRLVEHAAVWRRLGHEVEVLTAVPNFPAGEIFDGYENRLTREDRDGVDVLRVPMFVSANEGAVKRTLSYLSFMASSVWFARKRLRRPDVVVGTSPQFFCALGGYLIARAMRVPFVFEVRDLWPETILAVGAMKRGPLIQAFERVADYLYRHSDHLVVVTDTFRDHVIEHGARPDRVSVIKNGANLARLGEAPDPAAVADVRREFGLEGAFVAGYIGTVGMCHGLETVLEAAARTEDPRVRYLVVGTGAELAGLRARAAAEGIDNLVFAGPQPKERVPALLAATDVSIVHLVDDPVFRTVLPSKLFEAMATGTPILHAVQGESRALVEASGAGLTIPSGDPDAMAAAVAQLCHDDALRARLAAEGPRFVAAHFDRADLAARYADVLQAVIDGAPGPVRAPALSHTTITGSP